jgi:AraC family transcriptional regulator, transcriptional activator of pobA
MDKTHNKLHKTAVSRAAVAGPMPPRPSASLASGERPPEIIAVRLRGMTVENHFTAREWRLDTESLRGFDHCLVLQSGEAWLHQNGESLHVLSPSFVWSPANSAERLVIGAGGSGHFMQIRRDLIEQVFRQTPEAGELINLLAAEQPLALAIDAESATRLSGVLSLISSELQGARPGSETIISSALVISFVQLWRYVGARVPAFGNTVGAAALLMRFRQLVEERFREHWEVAQYAEALGVTPGRLHAIATRTLGRTPRALIQQRIIYEAAVRLERSAITVKQLSYMLGFRDSAYFNRFFAKHVGIPPARYRSAIVHRNVAGYAPQIPFTFYDWP